MPLNGSPSSITGLKEATSLQVSGTPSLRYTCTVSGTTVTLSRSYVTVNNALAASSSAAGSLTLYTFESPSGVSLTVDASSPSGPGLNVCAYDLQTSSVQLRVKLPDGNMYTFPAWSNIAGIGSSTASPPFLNPVSSSGGTFYRYILLKNSAGTSLGIQDLYAGVVNVNPATIVNQTGHSLGVAYSFNVNDGSTYAAYVLLPPSALPTGPDAASTLMLPAISNAPSPGRPTVSFTNASTATTVAYALPSFGANTGCYAVPVPSPLTLTPATSTCPSALTPLSPQTPAASAGLFLYCSQLGSTYTLTSEPVIPTSSFVLVNALQRYTVHAVYNDPLFPCEGGSAGMNSVNVWPGTATSTSSPTPLRHGATVSFYLFYAYANADGTPDTALTTNTGMLVTPSFAVNAADVNNVDWSTGAQACVTGVVDMVRGQFLVPGTPGVTKDSGGVAVASLPSSNLPQCTLATATSTCMMTLAINGFQYSVSIAVNGGRTSVENGSVTFTIDRAPRKSYTNLTSKTRAVHNDLCVPIEISVGSISNSNWLPIAPFQSESIACNSGDDLYVRSADGAYGLVFEAASGTTTTVADGSAVSGITRTDGGNVNNEYVVSGMEPLGLVAVSAGGGGSPSPSAVGLNVVNLSTVQVSVTFSPDVSLTLAGQPAPLLYGPTGGFQLQSQAQPSFSAWVTGQSYNTVELMAVGLTAGLSLAYAGSGAGSGTSYTLLDLLQDPSAGCAAGLSCTYNNKSNNLPAQCQDGSTKWPVLPRPPLLSSTNPTPASGSVAAYLSQHPLFTLYVLDPVSYLLFSSAGSLPSTANSVTPFTATVVFTPVSSNSPVTQTLSNTSTSVLPAQPSANLKDVVNVTVVYGLPPGVGSYSPPPLSCQVSDLFTPGFASPSGAYSIVPAGINAGTQAPAQATIAINPVTKFVFTGPSPAVAGVSLAVSLGQGSVPVVLSALASTAAFYVYGDLTVAKTPQQQGFNFTYIVPGQPPCTLMNIDASTLYTAPPSQMYISAVLPFLALTSPATIDPSTGLSVVQVAVLSTLCDTCVCTSVNYTPSTPVPSIAPAIAPSSSPGTVALGPSKSKKKAPPAAATKSSSTSQATIVIIVVVCVLAGLALAAAGFYWFKGKRLIKKN